MSYEFFPQSSRDLLPPLYSQEHNPDPTVQVKFFSPFLGWTWYAYEGSPVDENGHYNTDKEKVDYLFFGWVVGDYPELGYFSLNEMKRARIYAAYSGGSLGDTHFIERDITFSPTLLSEIRKLHNG